MLDMIMEPRDRRARNLPAHPGVCGPGRRPSSPAVIPNPCGCGRPSGMGAGAYVKKPYLLETFGRAVRMPSWTGGVRTTLWKAGLPSARGAHPYSGNRTGASCADVGSGCPPRPSPSRSANRCTAASPLHADTVSSVGTTPRNRRAVAACHRFRETAGGRGASPEIWLR
ncbi:MAG: hypothetical protein MZV70_15155 [Desulfobacterales bacterium]|nr:hypothetical protein [Desulfobacterales bacterium]